MQSSLSLYFFFPIKFRDLDRHLILLLVTGEQNRRTTERNTGTTDCVGQG